MKMFTLIAATLFSLHSFAEEMPAYLKDGVITVTLKDGKTYTFSANEYKVVKREDKKVEQRSTPCCSSTEHASHKSEEKKNRLSLNLGVGFDGQRVNQYSNHVDVTDKRAFVFGLSYGRKFYKDYSITGTIMSNETGFLGFGKDY